MYYKDKNLYIIGGAVRDTYLNLPNYDIDLCYEGDAIEFAHSNNFDIIKTNPLFGTVRILYDKTITDIASTRKEYYPNKGHLPYVTEIGCPVEEDLIRRDFTINAIAKRTTDGKIIDIFNGIKDIRNRTLRVLRKDSFIDDPTRIIRALKFSTRFGFQLSEETLSLQNDYLKNINYDISYHRLKKELMETFNLNAADAFDKFVSQGLYKLLGANLEKPKITGEKIKELIHNVKSEQIWLFYLAPFICSTSLLPLTRQEKRYLLNAEKLKTQTAGNNTPNESIIIRKLLDINNSI